MESCSLIRMHVWASEGASIIAFIRNVLRKAQMQKLKGILAAIALGSLISPMTYGFQDNSGQNGITSASSSSNNNQNTPASNSADPISFPTPNISPAVSPAQAKSLAGKEKFRFYLRHTAGIQALAYVIMGAGINQAMDSVPEWGQGMEGFGKRLGSRMAARTIKSSVHSGLGALLKEDPRYFYSNRSGIWNRALYATGQVFLAHKDSGGTRFAVSRFAGIWSAAYLSRQWRPREDRTAEQYLISGAIWIGLDMAKTVFSEFWPDIKRKLRH